MRLQRASRAGSEAGGVRGWEQEGSGIWVFGLSLAPVTSLLPIKLHPSVKRFSCLGTDSSFEG